LQSSVIRREYLIARAEAIPADVHDKIRGTDLDKGTYLDSIKGMEPDRAPPAPL
jgi:hypothetical protein